MNGLAAANGGLLVYAVFLKKTLTAVPDSSGVHRQGQTSSDLAA
jgi:hypothetical protein